MSNDFPIDALSNERSQGPVVPLSPDEPMYPIEISEDLDWLVVTIKIAKNPEIQFSLTKLVKRIGYKIAEEIFGRNESNVTKTAKTLRITRPTLHDILRQRVKLGGHSQGDNS